MPNMNAFIFYPVYNVCMAQYVSPINTDQDLTIQMIVS